MWIFSDLKVLFTERNNYEYYHYRLVLCTINVKLVPQTSRTRIDLKTLLSEVQSSLSSQTSATSSSPVRCIRYRYILQTASSETIRLSTDIFSRFLYRSSVYEPVRICETRRRKLSKFSNRPCKTTRSWKLWNSPKSVPRETIRLWFSICFRWLSNRSWWYAKIEDRNWFRREKTVRLQCKSRNSRSMRNFRPTSCVRKVSTGTICTERKQFRFIWNVLNVCNLTFKCLTTSKGPR